MGLSNAHWNPQIFSHNAIDAWEYLKIILMDMDHFLKILELSKGLKVESKQIF